MKILNEMFIIFRISRSGQLGAERSRAAAASGVQLERGTARGEEFKVRKGYSNAIFAMQYRNNDIAIICSCRFF
jgi:hypothetical protein